MLRTYVRNRGMMILARTGQAKENRFWDAPIRGTVLSLDFISTQARILGFANQERHFQPSRLNSPTVGPSLEMAFQAHDLHMPVLQRVLSDVGDFQIGICRQTGSISEVIMSGCISSEEWERWKNAIQTLYIFEDRPLQGPLGVIKLMEDRHGFKAT
jgi:hypothetical protein